MSVVVVYFLLFITLADIHGFNKGVINGVINSFSLSVGEKRSHLGLALVTTSQP